VCAQIQYSTSIRDFAPLALCKELRHLSVRLLDVHNRENESNKFFEAAAVRGSGVMKSLARIAQLASLDLGYSSGCDMEPLSALTSLTHLRRCAPYRAGLAFFALHKWPATMFALRTVDTEMAAKIGYHTGYDETERRARMAATYTSALQLRYPTLEKIS
jgi:hypothetical protein